MCLKSHENGTSSVATHPPFLTVETIAGRYAAIHGEYHAAAAFAASNRAWLRDSPVLDFVPLNKAQCSMVYPELLHGNRTANNVTYLFKPDGEAARPGTLSRLCTALAARFPILACRITDDAGVYGFDLADIHPPEDWPWPEHPAFDSEAACSRYFLRAELSLFDDPLFRPFTCTIRGEPRTGVLLHHIVGDHVGQIELLRALRGAPAASGDLAEPTELTADLEFILTNLALADEHERDADACLPHWSDLKARIAAARQSSGSDFPTAGATVTWHRQRITGTSLMPAGAHRQALLLARFKRALTAAFGVSQPLVHALFSMRKSRRGTGFSTYVLPLLLDHAHFGEHSDPARATGYLLATRAHGAIGAEAALAAAGLRAHEVRVLFNLVDMRNDDDQGFSGLVDETVPSESCKSDLDLTLLCTRDAVDIVVTSRFEPARVAAFARAFVEDA